MDAQKNANPKRINWTVLTLLVGVATATGIALTSTADPQPLLGAGGGDLAEGPTMSASVGDAAAGGGIWLAGSSVGSGVTGSAGSTAPVVTSASAGTGGLTEAP